MEKTRAVQYIAGRLFPFGVEGNLRGLAILGTALLCLATSGIANRAAAEADDSFDASTLMERIQADAAADTKKGLPRKIDDLTTIRDAASDGGTLILYVVVDTEGGNIDPATFAGQQKAAVKKRLCDNGAAEFIISSGGSYRYVYSDTHDAKLAEFVIDEAVCSSH